MKKLLTMLIIIFLITVISIPVYASINYSNRYTESELKSNYEYYFHIMMWSGSAYSEIFYGSNSIDCCLYRFWWDTPGMESDNTITGYKFDKWQIRDTSNQFTYLPRQDWWQECFINEQSYIIESNVPVYTDPQKTNILIDPVYEVEYESNLVDGSIYGSIGDVELSWSNFLLGEMKVKLNKVEAGSRIELKNWLYQTKQGNIVIPKDEIPIIEPGEYEYQIFEGDKLVQTYNFTYNYVYNQTETNQSDVDKTPLATEFPERIKAYISGSTPYKPMLLSLEKLKTFDTSDYRTLCPELHINLGDLLDASSSYYSPDLVGKLNIDVIYFDLSILNQIEFMGVPVIQYMRTLLSMGMVLFTALHIYHGFIPEKAIVGG